MGIRTYKITLNNDLKPGEYAFFMGTSEGNMMSSGRVTSSSGASAAGRITTSQCPTDRDEFQGIALE